MRKYKKNVLNIFVVTLMFILTTSLIGCTKATDNKETAKTTQKSGGAKNITIRFGHQPGHAQIIIAKELGYLDAEFAKDGITVETKQFASGPPIIEAFAAGELDFGMTGDQPAIQGRANNIDLKAIAAYASTEKGNALIAVNGSGINSIKDLKGKKVGFTVGSVGHQLLLKQLDSVGLKPSDIKMVNLSPADIYTSMVSKNIDAAVTWEPYITNAVSKNVGKIIADGTGFKYNVNVIVGNNAFLTKYPDITVRLLKVLDKAGKWADANPEKALNILSKSSGLDKEVMRSSFNKFDRSLALPQKSIDSITETAKYLKQNNIIRTEVDVKDFIDTSYLEKAGIK